MRTLAAFLCAVAAACGPTTTTTCTTEARAGLNVTVVDILTGAHLCDATVIASEGAYSETLSVVAPSLACVYTGAWERAGTYSISATKAGYQDQTQDGVVVSKDACHVHGAAVTISLAP